MKKKLMWVNVALVLGIAGAAYRVHEEWDSQQKQEQAVREKREKAPPLSPVMVPPVPPAVTAASYSDIANKMLFSPERNPNVVVEVPVKPPPKPMPPLPLLHGVMGLPSGMLALMSMKADTRSVGVHVGDKIGEFELAALDRDEISFHWEDKTVTKSVSEMIYHAQEQANVSAAAPAAAATAASAASAPGVPKAGAAVSGKEGVKSCAAGDTSPAGTVTDGYRKVLKPTPFGSTCLWELVK